MAAVSPFLTGGASRLQLEHMAAWQTFVMQTQPWAPGCDPPNRCFFLGWKMPANTFSACSCERPAAVYPLCLFFRFLHTMINGSPQACRNRVAASSTTSMMCCSSLKSSSSDWLLCDNCKRRVECEKSAVSRYSWWYGFTKRKMCCSVGDSMENNNGASLKSSS